MWRSSIHRFCSGQLISLSFVSIRFAVVSFGYYSIQYYFLYFLLTAIAIIVCVFRNMKKPISEKQSIVKASESLFNVPSFIWVMSPGCISEAHGKPYTFHQMCLCGEEQKNCFNKSKFNIATISRAPKIAGVWFHLLFPPYLKQNDCRGGYSSGGQSCLMLRIGASTGCCVTHLVDL